MKLLLVPVILLGILTAGCSTDIDLSDPKYYRDYAEKPRQGSGFKKYVEYYKKVTGDTRVTSHIKFVDKLKRPTAIGNCVSNLGAEALGDRNEVTILRSKWETLGELQRHTLILHELAHCELYFDHNKKDKHSIMFTSMVDEKLFESEAESGYTLFEYAVWRTFGYIEDPQKTPNYNDPLEGFYYDTHGNQNGGFTFYKTIHPDFGIPEVAKEWKDQNNDKPLFDIPDVDDLEGLDTPGLEDLIPDDVNPEDFLPAA